MSYNDDLSSKPQNSCDYESFFEESLDLLLILNGDFTIKKTNKAWAQSLGWSQDELIGKVFLNFIAIEEQKRTAMELQLVQKGEASPFFETKILCDYGETKTVSWSAWKNAKTKEIHASFKISEGINTVISELTRNQQMFQSIFDHIPVVVYVKEPGGVYFHVNKRFEILTGFSKKQVVGNCTDFDIFSKELAETFRGADQEILKLQTLVEATEQFSFNSKENRWYQSFRFPIFDNENHLMATGGIFIDITEKQDAQEKLKDTEERLRLAIAGTSAGVWDWDLTTNRIYFDKKWTSILQYDDNELPGVLESWTSTVYYEDLPKVYKALNSYWDGKSPRFSVRYRAKTKTGETKWISAEGASIHDNEGSPKRMIGWIRDITDEILLEDQLESERANAAHTSKMASLGEMAGGIAHEINNPLAIISGSASRLVSLFEKGKLTEDIVKTNCERIEKTTERIAKIIKGLRSFARDAEKDPFTLTLVNHVVNETLDFCRARFHSNSIELNLVPIAQGLYIDCRSVQVSQVLLNLLNNSFDAILGQSNPWIKIEALDVKEFIEIVITDSGNGIPEEIHEKIMQPFFTTKEIGKGTGLGLSISVGIIREHHGELFLDKTSTNTRFVVRLPKNQPQVKLDTKSA